MGFDWGVGVELYRKRVSEFRYYVNKYLLVYSNAAAAEAAFFVLGLRPD